MEAGNKRFVGLDLAKRTFEVCIVCDGTKLLRYGGIKSDATGRNRLASLETVEQERDKFKEKINAIVRESELSPYLMSIPGVGPVLAAFPAYVGDGSRFGKAGEAANYAGLVPVPDCSGETDRYGHIAQGGCKALRSVIVRAAWAASRSSYGGALRSKFIELTERKSKTKSAIAIARRIIGLMWILATRREFYVGASKEQLVKKFRLYKLNSRGWEALAS